MKNLTLIFEPLYNFFSNVGKQYKLVFSERFLKQNSLVETQFNDVKSRDWQ